MDISIQNNIHRITIEQNTDQKTQTTKHDRNPQTAFASNTRSQANKDDTTTMAANNQNNLQRSWDPEDYERPMTPISGAIIQGQQYVGYHQPNTFAINGETYILGQERERYFVEGANVYTKQRCPALECRWRTIEPTDNVTVHLGCGAISHTACFWYYNGKRAERPDWNKRCPSCLRPS